MGEGVKLELNREQRAFCENRKEHLITLTSPPGTGKTLSLARRCIALVEEGQIPERILVVTFTNEARDAFVAQLKESGAQWAERDVRPENRHRLEWDAPPPLWIGTFHDACARILRCHLRRLRYEYPVRIMNDEERQRRFENTVFRMAQDMAGGETETRAQARSIATRTARWKRAGVDPRDGNWYAKIARTVEKDPPRLSKSEQRIAAAYQSEIHRSNLWDFEDLPLITYRLLTADSAISEAWRRRFDHVVVDEVQDTEPLLVEVLTHLAANATLVIAGDSAQKIYGWRDVVAMKQLKVFERTHGKARHYRLVVDHRLPWSVQVAATKLRREIDHQMRDPPQNEDPGWSPPRHWVVQDDELLGEALAECVHTTLKSDGGARGEEEESSWGDFAIACRTNAQANRWGFELLKREIPIRIRTRSDGMRLGRILMTWLAAAAEPSDEVIASLCEAAPLKVARVVLDRPRRSTLAFGTALADEIRQAARNDDRLVQAASAIRELEQIRNEAQERGVRMTLERIIELSGLKAEAEAGSEVEREGYRDTLRLLRGIAPVCGGLDDLRRSIDEADDETWNRDAGPRVQIGTMHALKGTEWRHVVAIGWNEGDFPKNDDDEDEGRRLAYTTITRATRTFGSIGAEIGQNGQRTPVSRFIHEAGIEVRPYGGSK